MYIYIKNYSEYLLKDLSLNINNLQSEIRLDYRLGHRSDVGLNGIR